jgi:galactokinase
MLGDVLDRAFATWPSDAGCPEVAFRAPGRANIIGEHVDYNGLPVLPFAIDRNMVALASRSEDIRLCNADPRYRPERFRKEALSDFVPNGNWTDIPLAVLAGIRKESAEAGMPMGGITCLFASDLPAQAGLSSSGALAVALSLCYLAIHGNDALASRDRMRRLAERVAAWERGRGTATGAMDQAISLLGVKGHALRIEFNPLQETPIPLPDSMDWIVAHSLIRSDKGGHARDAYNKRVGETALAALHLSNLAFPGKPVTDLPSYAIYKALLARLRDPDDFLTVEDALAVLPKDMPVITKRVRHLLTEALRVDEACEMLRCHEAEGLGYLLDGSHESLRDDYEVSTPEVDVLVERLREGGALGARIVGAGFGGSVIALATAERTPFIVERVLESYYQTDLPRLRPELPRLDPDEVRSAIHVVRAAAGAEQIPL